MKFYPNPVKDRLHFSEEVSNIKITDLAGRTVKGIAASAKTADVTHLAKGVYLISATTNEGKVITKKDCERVSFASFEGGKCLLQKVAAFKTAP